MCRVGRHCIVTLLLTSVSSKEHTSLYIRTHGARTLLHMSAMSSGVIIYCQDGGIYLYYSTDKERKYIYKYN